MLTPENFMGLSQQRTLRALLAAAGLAMTWPALAQSQSPVDAEVQACVDDSAFDPDSFVGAKPALVKKAITRFLNCLDRTTSPGAPQVQLLRGYAHTFDTTPQGHAKARAAFCGAAKDGYVLAQEQCAVHSGEDANERYRWTLAAALNGSKSAQMSISINAWSGITQRADIAYNHYLVQYLSCHPAMLQQVCQSMKEPAVHEECRSILRETGLKQLNQCQADLNTAFLASTDKNTLAKWEQRAQKQRCHLGEYSRTSQPLPWLESLAIGRTGLSHSTKPSSTQVPHTAQTAHSVQL